MNRQPPFPPPRQSLAEDIARHFRALAKLRSMPVMRKCAKTKPSALEADVGQDGGRE